jgi:hypothetical protein
MSLSFGKAALGGNEIEENSIIGATLISRAARPPHSHLIAPHRGGEEEEEERKKPSDSTSSLIKLNPIKLTSQGYKREWNAKKEQKMRRNRRLTIDSTLCSVCLLSSLTNRFLLLIRWPRKCDCVALRAKKKEERSDG